MVAETTQDERRFPEEVLMVEGQEFPRPAPLV